MVPIEKGNPPPVIFNEADPSEEPKQDASVVITEISNKSGSIISILICSEQPFSSVTITL